MTDTNTDMQTQQKELVCVCLVYTHTHTKLLFIYLSRCSGLSQVHSLNACHYCWWIWVCACMCVCVAAKWCVCSWKRGKEEGCECKVGTKGKPSRARERQEEKERATHWEGEDRDKKMAAHHHFSVHSVLTIVSAVQTLCLEQLLFCGHLISINIQNKTIQLLIYLLCINLISQNAYIYSDTQITTLRFVCYTYYSIYNNKVDIINIMYNILLR